MITEMQSLLMITSLRFSAKE